jgi:hypothetical protein
LLVPTLPQKLLLSQPLYYLPPLETAAATVTTTALLPLSQTLLLLLLVSFVSVLIPYLQKTHDVSKLQSLKQLTKAFGKMNRDLRK